MTDDRTEQKIADDIDFLKLHDYDVYPQSRIKQIVHQFSISHYEWAQMSNAHREKMVDFQRTNSFMAIAEEIRRAGAYVELTQYFAMVNEHVWQTAVWIILPKEKIDGQAQQEEPNNPRTECEVSIDPDMVGPK
jgi:hypothetical protein